MISSYKKYLADAMTKAVDRCALDKYMAAMNFTLMPGRADKASRAQEVVWRIFMNGLAFISTEEGCRDPAHALAYWRDALSPEAMTNMR